MNELKSLWLAADAYSLAMTGEHMRDNFDGTHGVPTDADFAAGHGNILAEIRNCLDRVSAQRGRM
ncbi:MAG: hypothetical protein CML66_25780 [Rhodobacteraceae bacterium]|nr:hypothetical protein [Paracoccaceae bacterium]MAY44666.1 hypothetical protein [Paracoccaceae bacterium]